MKKKLLNFIYALVLGTFLVISPSEVKAAVDTHNGIKCEDEVQIGEGIVSKTCKINFDVVDKSFKTNKITLDFTLNNMTIESLKVNDGWKVTSQKTNSYIFESTQNEFAVGNHEIGTIVFYKIRAFEECEVKYSFSFENINRSCTYQNGTYYNKEGNVTTKIEFQKECETHKCEVLEEGETKYYFDDEGKVTDEENYNSKCNEQEKYYCQEKDGTYYDIDGEETDEDTFNKTCKPHYCEVYDENTYFGVDGKETDKLTYEKDCETHKCEELTDGTYFGKKGAIVDETIYKKECETHKCEVVDGTYYDESGNVTTKEKYDEFCGPTENKQTGITLPYIAAGIVIAGALGTYLFMRRKDKVFKI